MGIMLYIPVAQVCPGLSVWKGILLLAHLPSLCMPCCWLLWMWPCPPCLAQERCGHLSVSGGEWYSTPDRLLALWAEPRHSCVCCRAPQLRANRDGSLSRGFLTAFCKHGHLNAARSADNCQGISNCSCLPPLLLE